MANTYHTDSDNDDDHSTASDSVQPVDTDSFKLFDYISQSPTVAGVKDDDFKLDEQKQVLWAAYLQHKDKLENILEVLFTMNSAQRNMVCKEWTSRPDGGGTDLATVLKDFLSELKSEESALQLLLGMLKNTDELDSEWLHDALYDTNEQNRQQNDELVVEILCTRTRKQLRELQVSYKKRYNKDVVRDVRLRYKRDSNLVKMCESLLDGHRDENVLQTPDVAELTEDVKFISSALQQNKLSSTTLCELGHKLTLRSWRHIHDLCAVYAQLTGYSLQTSLQRKLSATPLPSNLAMVAIVEVSRSIHFYFAQRLSRILMSAKSSVHTQMLHRILLSRCEIDLGAIVDLFQSKPQLCEHKTLKQWITQRIAHKKQPMHLRIVLYLCGLPQSDADDVKVYGNVFGSSSSSDDDEKQVYYVRDYEQHVGSVTGVEDAAFKADLDVQSVMNWIHPIQDGQATKEEQKKLKDKLAKLLCNRNARQREHIAKVFRSRHKHAIVDYLRVILKKGSTLQICAWLLQSITGAVVSQVSQLIDAKDVGGLIDVLCTHDPDQLRDIRVAYQQRYGSDLMQELEETCTRQNKSTLLTIFEQLLAEHKYQRFVAQTQGGVANKAAMIDVAALKRDIKFLLSFKKSKVKSVKEDVKRRFVEIFTQRSKLYIRALHLQFQQISYDYSLMFLIDKIMGKSSGEAIKTILSYCVNQSEYFAQRIHELGSKNWKKHEQEIAFLLISRSEIDLYSIQLAFHDNLYADGKLLTQWVAEKTNESKTGLFLVLLLQALAKNKTQSEQTMLTMLAIAPPAFNGGYSNVYSPRATAVWSTPPGIFDPTAAAAGASLFVGLGANQLHLDRDLKVLDTYYETSHTRSVTKSKNKSTEKSKSSKAASQPSAFRQASVSLSKSTTATSMTVKPKKITVESVTTTASKKAKKAVALSSTMVVVDDVILPSPIPGAISTAVVVDDDYDHKKRKQLSDAERQEMARKIMNIMTKKLKLSDIDIKNKNNKIEPDELFEFFIRSNIGIPRYISSVVFDNIDMNGDGHITMFEYFKWKSKISVDKMYSILPAEIPDIDNEETQALIEGTAISVDTPVAEQPTPMKQKAFFAGTTTTTATAAVTMVEGVSSTTHVHGDEPDDDDQELKRLEQRMNLYKKLLDLTMHNSHNEPLNRNIFQAYCMRNAFGLSKKQISHIFDDMDLNGDGKVTPLEYFKWRDKISIGFLNGLLEDIPGDAHTTGGADVTGNVNALSSKPLIDESATQESKLSDVDDEKQQSLAALDVTDYARNDYLNLDVQLSILVDEHRKQWSLRLLDTTNSFNAKLSFLDFVRTHLSEKIVVQLFKKFEQHGVVCADTFAELLALTYTLYRTKLKKDHFHGDSNFMKMNSQQIRPKLEHFVIWVVRTQGKELTHKTHTVQITNVNNVQAEKIEIGQFNEFEFALNRNTYAKQLQAWMDAYVSEKGQHDDAETASMILQIWAN